MSLGRAPREGAFLVWATTRQGRASFGSLGGPCRREAFTLPFRQFVGQICVVSRRQFDARRRLAGLFEAAAMCVAIRDALGRKIAGQSEGRIVGSHADVAPLVGLSDTYLMGPILYCENSP